MGNFGWIFPQRTNGRLDAAAVPSYGPAMRPFLDLVGASGATYRFRLWPENEPHVPIAGNYAFVRESDEGAVEVVVLGATEDLSQARAALARSQRRGPLQVYTRLNVARTTREAEHADLAGGYASARAEPPVG
ncbi:hypothetical protein [Phenylobacterium sp.]|uniref:hypothetical protein n=1 Tax=Phenylobacterium sp. TaxID=1871053 RepID=UPI0035B08B47